MAGLVENLMRNAAEATLLAVLVAVVVRLAKLRAPARHVLWLIVLLKLFVPPIAIHSCGLSGFCLRAAERFRGRAIVQAPAVVDSPVAIGDRPMAPDIIDDSVRGAIGQAPGTSERASVDEPTAAATVRPIGQRDAWMTETFAESRAMALTPSEDLPAGLSGSVVAAASTAVGAEAFWDRRGFADLARGFIWFWAAGSLGLFAVRMKEYAAVLRLVRHAAAAPPSVVAACQEVARRFDLKRVPKVRVVARSLSPTVCVGRSTTILLPAELLARCGSHVVRSVLAHELAHVKRRDHWMCWVDLVGSCVYWWHPVFWWARRQVRSAADEAADAWAVSLLGCRRQYAESLLQTVELIVADRAVAAAWCPALGQRDTIARRLTMIMNEPLSRCLSWPAWLGIAVVGLLVLPAAPRHLGAQDAPKPPVSVPSEDEIAAAVEAFDAAVPQRPREPGAQQPPSRDRRPDEPRPPEAGRRDAPREQPRGGDRRPETAARDPERRLQELEEKLERIMHMLESRHGQAGIGAMHGAPAGIQPPGAHAGFTPFSGVQGPGSMMFSGARIDGFGSGRPAGVEDMLRDIELNPEQRERIEHSMNEMKKEFREIEAEQARAMQEFQRRRMDLERKFAEIVRDILGPEQRARLQQRRPDGREGARPEERGEGRPDGREGARPESRGPDRPREAGEPRRGSGGDRPREEGEPRRRPEAERPER